MLKMKINYLTLSSRPQIPFLHTPGRDILRAQLRRDVRVVIQTSRAHLICVLIFGGLGAGVGNQHLN